MQPMRKILLALAITFILQNYGFAQAGGGSQTPENNPTLFSGTYKYEICAGTKICFILPVNEIEVVKSELKIPDTIGVSWDHGKTKGSPFKIIDTKDRLLKYQFCWIPKESEASDIPYTLSLRAMDNGLPINEVFIKTHLIKVNPKASCLGSEVTTGISSPFETANVAQPDNGLFKIYPNPVSKYLFVNRSVNQPLKVEILNNLGQVVLVKTIVNNDESIDVSGFPSGIYYLKGKDGKNILMQKFIKTAD